MNSQASLPRFIPHHWVFQGPPRSQAPWSPAAGGMGSRFAHPREPVSPGSGTLTLTLKMGYFNICDYSCICLKSPHSRTSLPTPVTVNSVSSINSSQLSRLQPEGRCFSLPAPSHDSQSSPFPSHCSAAAHFSLAAVADSPVPRNTALSSMYFSHS